LVIGHLAGHLACARAPARPGSAPNSPSTCGWPPRAWTRPQPPARKPGSSQLTGAA
jgi:hypothetical protein